MLKTDWELILQRLNLDLSDLDVGRKFCFRFFLTVYIMRLMHSRMYHVLHVVPQCCRVLYAIFCKCNLQCDLQVMRRNRRVRSLVCSRLLSHYNFGRGKLYYPGIGQLAVCWFKSAAGQCCMKPIVVESEQYYNSRILRIHKI